MLDQIEHDAVNGRSIADTLRKAVILGGRAGSSALRDWATKELKGFGPDDELPPYRKIGAPILVDAQVRGARITGQRMGLSELPDWVASEIDEAVPFRQGIGEIEAVIRTAEAKGDSSVRISLPMAADVARFMNDEIGDPFQHIETLYWSVYVGSLHGIVDQVRTALTELVAEMRAGTPSGQDLPSAAVTNQAVSVAIHGKNARVVVNSQAAGGDATATTTTEPASEPSWWTATRIVWAVIVGVAGIAGTWFTYLQLES